MNPQLPGIGAAILAHRRGFEPDQLRPAPPVAVIAAPGELAGVAVELAVAAFHRVDADGVANAKITNHDRPRESGADLLRVALKPDMARTSTAGVKDQILQALIGEVLH